MNILYLPVLYFHGQFRLCWAIVGFHNNCFFNFAWVTFPHVVSSLQAERDSLAALFSMVLNYKPYNLLSKASLGLSFRDGLEGNSSRCMWDLLPSLENHWVLRDWFNPGLPNHATSRATVLSMCCNLLIRVWLGFFSTQIKLFVNLLQIFFAFP